MASIPLLMPDDRPASLTKRIESEVDDAVKLRSRRPWLFRLLVFGLVVFAALWTYDHFAGIPRLKDAISKQENTIENQRAEITLLETQLAPAKTAAILKYGKADAQALALIADDLRNFEQALRRVENKIRTFSTEITIEFSSKWKDGKPPDPTRWFRTSGNRAGHEGEVTFELRDNRKVTATLGRSEGLSIIPLTEGFVRLNYRLEALPGCEIFGELPEDFLRLAGANITAVGASRQYSDGNDIRVRKLELRFYANGKPMCRATIETNDVLELPTGGHLMFQLEVALPLLKTGL